MTRYLFCRHSDGVPIAQLVTLDHLREFGAYYQNRKDGFLIATDRTIDGGSVPLTERLDGAIKCRNFLLPLLTG